MTPPVPESALAVEATMALPALGLDGRTGRPSSPALDVESVAALAFGHCPEPAAGAARGVMPSVDPDDLASAGWAAVFARDTPPAVRRALEPLLAHRERQAARLDADRFCVLDGADAYQPGDRTHHFLMRQGAGFGPVDPDQLPYYLLLVGGPESIPFDVEHQLGVQYAVGRIAFDTPEEYAAYAESVVEAELGPVPVRERSLGVLGVTQAGDRATDTLRRRLLEPLIDHVGNVAAGWRLDTRFGDSASKRNLCALLGGNETPGVLVTGSHGLGFACQDPLQRDRHGALVCSGWPGAKRGARGAVAADSYVAASDVDDHADVLGLVAIHVACYSGGVPAWDRYSHREADDPSAPLAPRRLAPKPFVCRLPQRLLGHPRGGAAAVIGHVDRAWGYGWAWADRGEQNQTFRAVLGELLAGRRIGHALRFFGERYGELSAALAAMVEEAQYGDPPPALEIARLWTARNDARGWVLLGDPAVRAVAGGLRR